MNDITFEVTDAEALIIFEVFLRTDPNQDGVLPTLYYKLLAQYYGNGKYVSTEDSNILSSEDGLYIITENSPVIP